jgi:hypothetical protein
MVIERVPNAWKTDGRDRPATHPANLSPLFFLVALITLIIGTIVSSGSAHSPETRVRPIVTPTAITVGSETTESPGSVGCLRPETGDVVSGSCVATEAAGLADDAAGSYGPFHRLEIPTQTPTIAALQEANRGILGARSRGGLNPNTVWAALEITAALDDSANVKASCRFRRSLIRGVSESWRVKKSATHSLRSTTHCTPEKNDHQQSNGCADAGDYTGGTRMDQGQRNDRGNKPAFSEAGNDVGQRFGRQVDRQPARRFGHVAHKREPRRCSKCLGPAELGRGKGRP